MRGIIAWFVHNPVAANLIMWILIVGGLLTLPTVRQEEFPNVETNRIVVTVDYLGAAPEEVESGVCMRIEEAVEGSDGIEKLRSSASEGRCTVRIEFLADADMSKALIDIKGKVDGIDSFPVEAEKPQVSHAIDRGGVLQIAIVGPQDEGSLKLLGETIRDEIANLAGVSQVDLSYVRPSEISIEVSEQTLRQYGLTLQSVADAVAKSSIDLPGGSLKTKSGQILLRTQGQRRSAADFDAIVIISNDDGTYLTLSDIAQVKDSYQDIDLRARFDGAPAVMIEIFRVGDEDTLEIAQLVKDYLVQKRQQVPQGVSLSVWLDESDDLVTRIDTLTTNARSGLIMVLLVLALFLRFRLAMWVAAGIPIAFAGAFMLFPAVGLTISTLSVMALILVLGIVVDDAIVVGERVYAYEQKGLDQKTAAIKGTQDVAVPVIFGVLTTMVTFLPLIFVPGRMGAFFGVIGVTVIVCLFFSVLESQLVLPSHLAHRKPERNAQDHAGLLKAWLQLQTTIGDWLQGIASGAYQRLLSKAIEWRYLTLSIGLGIVIVTTSFFPAGYIGFQFFPPVEGDRVIATLNLPEGVPLATTEAAVLQIEQAGLHVINQLNAEHMPEAETMMGHMFSSLGTEVSRGGPPRKAASGAHIAEVVIELKGFEQRAEVHSWEVANLWRQRTGAVTDAVSLTYSSEAFSLGEAVNIQLKGRNVNDLRAVAKQIRQEMAKIAGVFDISDSFRAGKREIRLKIKPEAEVLGLTLGDLGTQVRQGFYGAEVQRFQRGPDDVRVMVRFPQAQRSNLTDLENMRIRTRSGEEVPFSAVAEVDLAQGYSTIKRVDRQRVVNVTANVDRGLINPDEVIALLQQQKLPALLAQYPGVSFSLEGEQEEQAKAIGGLVRLSFLALMAIYALLAVPLKSYLQPLVIMSVIPFGAVGAILGHLIMGRGLVFFSLLGIIALSGVVVNSSLVLVDYVNQQRNDGVGVLEALLEAGQTRFRPILLTSITTFVGLVPIMSSSTPATAFLVPMCISLGFGVLFATAITLLLVPSLYQINEDIKYFWQRLSHAELQLKNGAVKIRF